MSEADPLVTGDCCIIELEDFKIDSMEIEFLEAYFQDALNDSGSNSLTAMIWIDQES